MKLLNIATGVTLIFASLVMPKIDKPKEIVELQFPEVVYLDAELPKQECNEIEDNEVDENDIYILAKITMAEAGNQSELGKRLVIDTVLNRVESPTFPNSIEGVVFQSGQFSPIRDGGYAKAYVDEDICRLIYEELDSRTDTNVLYFNARHFSKYGTPYLVEGAHYFSK